MQEKYNALDRMGKQNTVLFFILKAISLIIMAEFTEG
jgi:hypothetical protein